MIEIWAKIKNYPAYEVSTLGKIKRVIPDYMGRVGLLHPVTYKGENGYKRIMLYPDRKIFFVHRLVAEAFVGKSSKQINHKNGIKDDNRLENLEWCTAKENTAHADKMGLRNVRGSKNSTSKLKEEQVLKIRRTYSFRNNTQKMLAKKYGVCLSTIAQIIRRKIWKHI